MKGVCPPSYPQNYPDRDDMPETKVHTVTVIAEWESHDTFEFDTEVEADAFRDHVNNGGEGGGLDAITEQGDITSANASLINWRAS